MLCKNPYYSDDIVDCSGERIAIPCGKCRACIVNKQNDLCDRMLCAYQSHKCSAFVTFTYDDEHLVFSERSSRPTLVREHAHRYIDKIRHMVDSRFEYYLCGEYGDRFSRPHYHAVFFGLDYIYHKPFFERTWKNGTVKVMSVTSGCFRYVAKYISDAKSRDDYLDYGVEPPFSSMSRGLGFEMYSKHFDEIQANGFFMLGNKRISLPRYYFNKLCRFDERFIALHERAVSDANRRTSEIASRFGLSVDDYLKRQREIIDNALASRSLKNSSHF